VDPVGEVVGEAVPPQRGPGHACAQPVGGFGDPGGVVVVAGRGAPTPLQRSLASTGHAPCQPTVCLPAGEAEPVLGSEDGRLLAAGAGALGRAAVYHLTWIWSPPSDSGVRGSLTWGDAAVEARLRH